VTARWSGLSGRRSLRRLDAKERRADRRRDDEDGANEEGGVVAAVQRHK
jgi:hypothetical protein